MRTNRQNVGDKGEAEVARCAPCPNCRKRLVKFSKKNYPLYDLQCESCFFRVQVKTSGSSPKSTVPGAGWDIINKVLKAGFLAPPLIVNFKGKKKKLDQSEILFFPFVTKQFMDDYTLGDKHPQKGYKMFNYARLNKLPHFRLVKHGKKRCWEAAAPEAQKEDNY